MRSLTILSLWLRYREHTMKSATTQDRMSGTTLMETKKSFGLFKYSKREMSPSVTSLSSRVGERERERRFLRSSKHQRALFSPHELQGRNDSVILHMSVSLWLQYTAIHKNRTTAKDLLFQKLSGEGSTKQRTKAKVLSPLMYHSLLKDALQNCTSCAQRRA